MAVAVIEVKIRANACTVRLDGKKAAVVEKLTVLGGST